VSGVLPQEQAEVVLVEDKKQYARAQVKRRLTDSPQRQAPRCPILASAAAANSSMPASASAAK
jgi:tRNA/tmRNA/rRNA uracil-C5-methylase (TrmA/RlmC/RlmD family)